MANKLTNQKLFRAAIIGGEIFQVAAIAILFAAMPFSRDTLNYQLAIHKIYLARGIFSEFPSISFSYFPMNIDLLYLIRLYFNSDIAVKHFYLILALLATILIYRTVRKWVNGFYGLLGALTFLRLPVSVKLSIIVYVDLGSLCINKAAMFGLLNWVDDGLRLLHVVVSQFANKIQQWAHCILHQCCPVKNKQK